MSLGPPTNRPQPPKERWVPLPHNPKIERNTVTGKLRTNEAPPQDQPLPWPNYGVIQP